MAAEITLYDISTDPATVTILGAATAAEIPAGAIVLYTDGTGPSKAMTMAQVKAFVSPSVVGQHIATITLPTGEVTADDVLGWTVESGIPSSISGREFDGVDNADIVIPSTRAVDTQRGWFVALEKNDTVIAEASCLLSYYQASGATIPDEVLWLRSSAGNPVIRVVINWVEFPVHIFAAVDDDFTVDAADTFEIKLYILQ